MKVKIQLTGVLTGVLLLYFLACTKRNAVELGAGGCDTSNVSYSRQIVPILQDNCYSCHQGPGASSGVDFSNYDAFRGWAGSGYVAGNITGAPGYIRMPYGLPPLSGCDINTILAWIHQGTPDN